MMLDKVKKWWSSSASLVRQSPHILLAPVAVFALFCGLGIFGVFSGIRALEDQSRSAAQYEIDNVAAAVEMEVARAVMLLGQVSDYIRFRPGYTSVALIWNAVAPIWWKMVPKGSRMMFIAPQGIMNFTYPPTALGSAQGKDILTLPNRMLQATAIKQENLLTPNMTVSGPFLLDVEGGKSSILLFLLPIFIGNASLYRDWDAPFTGSACANTTQCWNKKTDVRWWGFAAIAIETTPLIQSVPAFDHLIHKQYKCQIWPGSPENTEMLWGSTDSRPDNALVRQVTIANQTQQWQLYVWKTEWYPGWVLPMIAVVVMASLAIATLLFVLLLSREEHRALLHSLLPKSTIARMRDHAEWTKNVHLQDIERLELETPARHMLVIISDCLEEQRPPVQLLLSVRDALHRTADVYRPTAADLKGRLAQSANVDAEVRQALVAQLMDDSSETSEEGPGAHDPPYMMNWASHSSHRPPGEVTVSHTSSISGIRESPIQKSGLPGTLTDLESTNGTTALIPAGRVLVPTVSLSLTAPAAPLALAPDMSSHSLATMDHLTQLPLGTGHQLRSALTVLMRNSNQVAEEDGSVVPQAEADMQVMPRFTPPPGLGSTNGGPAAAAMLAALPQHRSNPGFLTGSDARAVEGVVAANGTVGKLVAMQAGGVDGFHRDQHLPNIRQSASFVNSAPRRPLWTQLEVVLSTADSWAFDAYALEEASCGHPLSVLGYWLISQSGLMIWAHIDSDKLVRFLQHIENGYPSANPYHNRRHAAEVLQAMHMLITQGGLMPGYVDQTSMLACYLAAIVHDYEHKGRNNDFLVNSHDDLAVRYNDKSPMENHHLAAAWNTLRRPELNCLSGLPKATWLKLRKLMIELVLATDMKQHFAILGQFDALHRATGNDRTPTQTPPETQSGADAGPSGSGVSPAILLPASDNDKTLSLQMALKVADLANLASPLHVYLRWVRALEEEFFQQGDAERAAGLALSPLCDRNKEGVSKSQVGFFDFVACPLFKAFTGRFTAASPMMASLMNNYKYWQVAHHSTGGFSQASSADEDSAATATEAKAKA